METPTNELQKAGSSIKEAGSSVGNYVADKTRKVTSDAKNTLQDKIDDLDLNRAYQMAKDKAEDVYTVAKETTQDAIDASATFVKRHPFYTIAGAAAVGFVAASLLRRKH